MRLLLSIQLNILSCQQIHSCKLLQSLTATCKRETAGDCMCLGIKECLFVSRVETDRDKLLYNVPTLRSILMLYIPLYINLDSIFCPV